MIPELLSSGQSGGGTLRAIFDNVTSSSMFDKHVEIRDSKDIRMPMNESKPSTRQFDHLGCGWGVAFFWVSTKGVICGRPEVRRTGFGPEKGA